MQFAIVRPVCLACRASIGAFRSSDALFPGGRKAVGIAPFSRQQHLEVYASGTQPHTRDSHPGKLVAMSADLTATLILGIVQIIIGLLALWQRGGILYRIIHQGSLPFHGTHTQTMLSKMSA